MKQSDDSMVVRRAVAAGVWVCFAIAFIGVCVPSFFPLVRLEDKPGITTRVYGFPMPFLSAVGSKSFEAMPTDFPDPSILPQFHPFVLIFDIFFLVLVALTSGYSVFMWSARWPIGGYVCYYLICFGMWPLVWFQELSSALHLLLGVYFLGLMLLIPLSWLPLLWYAAYEFANRSRGERAARAAPALATITLGALAFLCWPYGVFSHPNRHDVAELGEYLSDDDPRIRGIAVACLRWLGPYDQVTARKIINAMSDSDVQVRSGAFSLAPELGPFAIEAVPKLIDCFENGGGCTFELVQLGPVAKEAVPVLQQQLPTANGYSKLGICEALWAIDGNADLVVPALIDLLSEGFGPIRVDAATLLGEIGADASEALPALQAIIDHVPPTTVHPAEQNDVNDSAPPTMREITELEFSPRIRSAAQQAVESIERDVQLRERT